MNNRFVAGNHSNGVHFVLLLVKLCGGVCAGMSIGQVHACRERCGNIAGNVCRYSYFQFVYIQRAKVIGLDPLDAARVVGIGRTGPLVHFRSCDCYFFTY